MLAFLSVITGFVVTLFLGNALLGYLRPDYHLVMWMVIGGGFLFIWLVSLLGELQRSELLSVSYTHLTLPTTPYV